MSNANFQFGSLRMRTRMNAPSVWEFRYRVTDATGKRRTACVILGTTTQYPTKAHLGAKLQSLILTINNAAHLRMDLTVETLICRFVTEERLEEINRTWKTNPGTLHYSTARAYLAVLNKYIRPKWGALPLISIRAAVVQEWLNGLALAPKTKANIRGLLHQLFEKALLWEYVDLQRNPIGLVKIKGISKRRTLPTVLTVEQFNAIIARLPRAQRTMVFVAQLTGLRASEILALQWNDVDFHELTLLVTRAVVNGRVDQVKTEYSKDLLPLDPHLAEILRAWQAHSPASPDGWIFANPITMRPYLATTIQKDYLRKIGAELGIRLGWHTFRHTYRSWLDATGAPVGVQQKLMRHAQVSTTMNVYGNALMKSKRDANSKLVSMVLEEQQISVATQS